MPNPQAAIAPPETHEYAPYYGRYISLVKPGDILNTLREQGAETVTLLKGISEEKSAHRYAPEKWSIKEVVGHVNDTERIFAYRVLRISRNDRTPIEGYDQDDYVRFGPSGQARMEDLVEEFAAIRQATLALLRGLNAEAWPRRGIANQLEISVRALAYVIAGHELHHRKILKEQYLKI